MPKPVAKTRRKWDAYRRISAWAGVLEIISVIIVIANFSELFPGGDKNRSTSLLVIFILGAPAVLAGLVSGSRYYAFYADLSQRVDPTAALSIEDSESGGAAASSFLGDGIWGSLIAGIAGSIPGVIAMSSLFGPFGVLIFPFLVLILGICWFAGWTCGAVTSMLLSAAIGIAAGASKRGRNEGYIVFMTAALFLPTLLIAVVIPVLGIRFPDGQTNVWAAILFAAGAPVEGAEFVLVEPLKWLAAVAIWLAVALFAALVIVGTPALLKRLGLWEYGNKDVS